MINRALRFLKSVLGTGGFIIVYKIPSNRLFKKFLYSIFELLLKRISVPTVPVPGNGNWKNSVRFRLSVPFCFGTVGL